MIRGKKGERFSTSILDDFREEEGSFSTSLFLYDFLRIGDPSQLLEFWIIFRRKERLFSTFSILSEFCKSIPPTFALPRVFAPRRSESLHILTQKVPDHLQFPHEQHCVP